MKITIHRGIDQIGGCITEIESNSGTKILVDLGHNLPEGENAATDKYDNSDNLEHLLNGVNHIFYSHYHNDHMGFEGNVDTSIVQHIGGLSLEMVKVLKQHMTGAPSLKADALNSLSALNRFEIYVDNVRKQYGDIWVTPLPVSHSAIDAHMFLIECDGKIVLHTGDFRDHGYRGMELLKDMEHNLPEKIDVLITEGTMLSRDDNRVMKEEDLQEKALQLFKDYKYAFVLCSSMDADRLTSFIQAAKREGKGRRIVADRYQIQQICLIKKNLPTPYSDVFAYNFYKDTDMEIDRMKRYGFLMFVRNSDTFKENIKKIMTKTGIKPSDVGFIYSQFEGYIHDNHKAFNPKLKAFVDLYHWNVEYLHTSGHASREALEYICELANPTTAVIPIHKEGKGTLQQLNLKINCPIIESSACINDVDIQIK